MRFTASLRPARTAFPAEEKKGGGSFKGATLAGRVAGTKGLTLPEGKVEKIEKMRRSKGKSTSGRKVGR